MEPFDSQDTVLKVADLTVAFETEEGLLPAVEGVGFTLDRLIDAYRASLDEDERIRLSLEIQEVVHTIGAFVPTFMVPYFREAYWRWWRFPDPPGTKMSGTLFEPFDSSTGGLFWFDAELKSATRKAMKEGRALEPVTSVDETFRAQ